MESFPSLSLRACIAEEFFPLNSTGIQNVQNARSQTTAQPVSLGNCGRDAGPSHPHYSNKAVPGNERMVFPDHPAANAYGHDLGGNFNQQPFQYHSYNPSGPCSASHGVVFQHGLPPPTELYANMPLFAEPFEYTHVAPATFNSSFSSSAGSSIASERMASMTLECSPHLGRTVPMDFRGNQHAPPTIRGQGWVENCPATISPKMLRINPSPTPTPSSEPIQVGMTATGGDLGPGSYGWDQQEVHNTGATKRSSHKARKDLPTKPIKSRLAPPSLSRDPAASNDDGNAYTRHNSGSPLRCLTESGLVNLTPKIQPPAEAEGPAGTASSDSADAERDAERDAKNRFLVESKLAGMTYREIRRQGGFTEAESTLRGRFRTLTKNKEQRVRKPEWQDKDVRLLKKAVRKLAKGDRTSAKVPWKQVAGYIYEHGGSYHFGNATCRKKWDDLVDQGAAGLP
ncbi:hypothetical protein F4777DRAFT_592460 [Nemania sp. FL0916]|nr:hypothetical protein F4777DRAFT_592460 [Nemania sp. FL0916]